MIQHTNALVALLKTVPAYATRTWVSRMPTGTKVVLPYRLVHPADGTNTQERVTGPRSTMHPRFTVQTIGANAEQVQEDAADLEALLTPNFRGIVLAVAGERCSPIWYSSPIPIDFDSDLTPALVWHTAEVGFDAEPAPGFVPVADGLYTTDGLVETPPGSGLYAF